MNKREEFSGPQFHGDRPREQEAVRTTIVGGRPPGSGQSLGGVPRGIEILLKKASVDPGFKNLLLARRVEAAETIGLTLEPSEVLMLQSAPADQLEAVIDQTRVPQEHRRVFLGHAAAAMLAALGVAGLGSGSDASEKFLPPPAGVPPTPPPPPDIPKSPTPEQIEQYVITTIARRLGIDREKVTRDASLVEDLKASEIQLNGLKRQLERDLAIKLGGEDFFAKVKTVGDLIKAVQAAVKDRPEPKPDDDAEASHHHQGYPARHTQVGSKAVIGDW